MTPAMVTFAAALLTLSVAAVAVRASTATIVAVLQVVALGASVLVGGAQFHGLQWPLFGIDVLLLAALVLVVLRGKALWPIASTGLHLVTVAGHLARLTHVELSAIAYGVMVEWMAWPSLVVLLVGIVLDRRAGRIFSPPWARWSPTAS